MSISSAQKSIQGLLDHVKRAELESLLITTYELEVMIEETVKTLGYCHPPIKRLEASGTRAGYTSWWITWRWPNEDAGHGQVEWITFNDATTKAMNHGSQCDPITLKQCVFIKYKWTEEDRNILIDCLTAWDSALERKPAKNATKKRPGRKPIFDAAKDTKLYNDYKASDIRSVKEFAQKRGLKHGPTNKALKRVRARNLRNKNPRQADFN